MSTSDPFLQQRILDLTDTAMQRKLRKLAPMPVGAVFLPWPGMTEDEAREQLRTMKELGRPGLKQTMGSKEWPTERIYRVDCGDEGIYPFWYAEAGWEDITPDLLTKLGLADMDIDEAMEHPVMLAYQKEIINQQIETDLADRQARRAKQSVKLADEDKNKSLEEIRARQYVTPGVRTLVTRGEWHEVYPTLIKWLKKEYGSVEGLKEAWNSMAHATLV